MSGRRVHRSKNVPAISTVSRVGKELDGRGVLPSNGWVRRKHDRDDAPAAIALDELPAFRAAVLLLAVNKKAEVERYVATARSDVICMSLCFGQVQLWW